MSTYYTLVSKEMGRYYWTKEFGDYRRSVVVQELKDIRHHFGKGTQFKIVSSGDTQEAIELAIQELR